MNPGLFGAATAASAAASASTAGAPPALQAFFLDSSAAAGGQRLALFHPATAPARGSVLFLHAFGEEMNKSRRMAALASRALAAAGFAVLQIDLLGCGDSSGDIDEAGWGDWIDDAVLGADWLQQQGSGPLWLWGQRAGCLLAAAAAQRLPGVQHFLFWQPQVSGKLTLQQFLRLKMASQMQHGASKGVTESLHAELAQGRAVEVAGYRITPALALGMAAAGLQPPLAGNHLPPPLAGNRPAPPPETPRGRLVWLEVTSRVPAALLPASAPVLSAWREAGYAISSQAVAGPPFWQTVEIEDAPDLVQATVELLLQQEPAAAPVPA